MLTPESVSLVKLICGVGSFTVVHLLAIIVAVNFADSGGNPKGSPALSLSDWLLIQGFVSLGSCVIWLGGCIVAVKYGDSRWWWCVARCYVALVCLCMVIWVAIGVVLIIHRNCVGSTLEVLSIITMVVQVGVVAVAGVAGSREKVSLFSCMGFSTP